MVIAAAVIGGGAAYLGLSGRTMVPLSQLGSVTQVVNTTTISVTYSRPVARGRTLFGPEGVVHLRRVLESRSERRHLDRVLSRRDSRR